MKEINEINIKLKQNRLDILDGNIYTHVTAPRLGDKPLDLEMLVVRNCNNIDPIPGESERKPAILWLMGGAWIVCPPVKVMPFLIWFARRGYVVAAARYRTTPEAAWPAQIVDAKTAVRYLRANAEVFGIDPAHIGVMGLSAGGHLTNMMAMNTDDWEKKDWAEEDDSVQAAVSLFGPADLRSCAAQREANGLTPKYHVKPLAPRLPEGAEKKLPPLPFEGSPEELLVGGPLAENPEIAADADPTTHISEKSAPLLMFHGEQDTQVPYQQSVDLYKALQDAGRPSELYLVPDADHADHHFFQKETQEIILEFLDRYLKPEEK
ncbi:MAG: alpha/beta hydrolase [Oscillospiraceae bacterium]|nr:alpha/beta hydrolase [Oscillospiraceae bacterium]